MAKPLTRSAEVANRLAVRLAAAKQQRLLARGRAERKLVEGEALATSLEDACASSIAEAQCANANLGNSKEPDVIGNSANSDSDLALVAITSQELADRLDRKRVAIHTRSTKPLKHNLVEVCFSTPCKKTVKLHKQPDVQILRHWFGAPGLLSRLTTTSLDVNAHCTTSAIPETLYLGSCDTCEHTGGTKSAYKGTVNLV